MSVSVRVYTYLPKYVYFILLSVSMCLLFHFLNHHTDWKRTKLLLWEMHRIERLVLPQVPQVYVAALI